MNPSTVIKSAEVAFFVEGAPVPKGRPRFTKTGHAFTPARTRAWEEVVAWAAKSAMAGRAPLVGNVSAHLTFYGARKNADMDNLCKAVLDACNGVTFHDDKQVKFLTVERSDDKRVGVHIDIKELP